MPKGILIAYTRPSDPSREEEYNEWYNNTHLPEVLEVPGFVAGHRYRVHNGGTEGPSSAAAPYPYVAVFELNADDITAPIAELGARGAAGKLHMSDAIEVDPSPLLTVYELIE